MADATVQNFIDDFMTSANEAAARTALGLGTAAVANLNNMAVTGGTIDGTTIGGTTPAEGTFTTLAATSLSVAQGTLTNPATGLSLTATWNDAADTFDALDISVTNTNSGANSRLIRARVGGSDVFSVRRDGYVLCALGIGANLIFNSGGGICASTTSSFFGKTSVLNSNSGAIALGGALGVTSGSGSPEGVVTANVGTLYLRTDGGASTTLYVKETGTGNTGWVAK